MSYPMRRYGDFMLVNPIDATGSGYKRYNPYYRNYRRGGAFGDHVRKFTRGVGRAAKKGYSIFKNAAHGVNGAMALLNLATRGANRTSPVQYFQMGTGTLVALEWLIRMCRYLRSNNPPPEENEELRRLTQELTHQQELIRGLVERLEIADRDLRLARQDVDLLEHENDLLRLPPPPPQAADYPLDVPLPAPVPLPSPGFSSSPSSSPIPAYVPPAPYLFDPPSPVVYTTNAPIPLPAPSSAAAAAFEPYVKQQPSDDDDDFYGHGYGYGYDDDDDYANMFSMAGQPYTMNGSGFIKNLWGKLKKAAKPVFSAAKPLVDKIF